MKRISLCCNADVTNKGFFKRGLGKASTSELVTLLESVREEYSEVAVAYTHVNSPTDHINTLTHSSNLWHPCVILSVKQQEQKG